ncbi:hypothetical protein ONS95_004993 [Cadophora gregata]|uniref:uncharacterized protein n=1 Tax=Cadophora gregata TaxID=51156 RepID=UPI0026DB0AEB|nr:uncharacterized protein ONS95_004993 [Cadophora gregata]KAK0104721.1 hypothetical protein ONS95_004993 [Cadophora gregata]KAK0115196.1 hypothetical protein ONS96_013662 [Cadophora gregata f. sp. sojae]
MSNPAIQEFGWTAVPRRMSTLLKQSQRSAQAPQPISVSSVSLPNSHLAKAVHDFAKTELSTETYNHSMRVFYYGQAIVRQAFPAWSTSNFNETYFLTCLLHDIGTTDRNITATLMSFEFYGGLIALDLLKHLSAPIEQAENVVEAVIRHQDLGDTGTITRLGALIQLATVFDNMGMNPTLVHEETIRNVVTEFPRNKWSSCFAKTIRKENFLKPWAHTTHLGESEFPCGVENNQLMAPYDDA